MLIFLDERFAWLRPGGPIYLKLVGADDETDSLANCIAAVKSGIISLAKNL